MKRHAPAHDPRHLFSLLAFCLLPLCAPGPSAAQPPAQGLCVNDDGILLKDGQPYRGVGVNYFDAFYRTLLKPGDTSYEHGLEVLAQHNIPFARFMCGGFWPAENKLYLTDKQQYFSQLDAFVNSARKHGVGLVPSLFWNISTVPDLVAEPCDQWGNPQSKTHQFMRTYTREVVARYKDSPAIWAWEFGNEYNLPADLPNAADHRPPLQPQLGTPSTRSARDDVSHDMVRTAFVEFAREVRRHDPHRIIATGNSFPRPSAWHQWQEKSWTKDTPEQWAKMLAADNPDPVNAISVHAYGSDVDRIATAARIALRLKKPLFVGEFGVPGPRNAENEKDYVQILAAIENASVPLAALWVFDFGAQGEFSVTAANDRRYQLEAIQAANQHIRAALPKAR